MCPMMLAWTELVLGIWILISPWLLGASANSLMLWSNVLVGLVLVVLNLWMIFTLPTPRVEEEEVQKTNGGGKK